MTKYRISKSEWDSEGGIGSPRVCRIMRGNRWTYWRLT